jgi:hypothetical protein
MHERKMASEDKNSDSENLNQNELHSLKDILESKLKITQNLIMKKT